MKTLRMWVCSARLLGPAFAALLLASTLAPATVSADTNLVIGGAGVIAYANGDNVLLRSGPSYQDAEITRFPEGTSVDIVDGTFGADDGTSWYKVSVDGYTGYIVSDFLAAGVSATNDSGITTGSAVTNDSVFLRTGPSTADGILRTLSAGEKVTLTGASQDGWNSVSATGGDGWVFAEYLDFGGPTQGTRFTIDTVHLRSGPGTSFDSVTYLDVGVQLEMTGEQEGGFVKVSTPFGTGWVSAQYIAAAAPQQPAQPVEPEAPGETGTRYTIDTVHLRTGPGTSFDSVTYLDAGVQLELSGDQDNGFVEVASSFGEGWVFAQFIGATVPEIPEVPEAPAEPVVRFATSNVNLRSGSSQVATVIAVIASGTEVEFSGATENGYSRVTTTAGAGWIASEFLSETRPETPAQPEPTSSLIAWPVSGGEWFISQGYNGSSHQNRTQYWQYYYSFDLRRSDGDSAGQPVYSPVNGTVRWIDESTGGMSIYMGNGLAYAFFHARLDPGIQEGDTLAQGQFLGTIAPAGEAGSGGSAHLHITVWQTEDEGNWSRVAIPFTGNAAIDGIEFPATGAGNDYRGYTFNP